MQGLTPGRKILYHLAICQGWYVSADIQSLECAELTRTENERRVAEVKVLYFPGLKLWRWIVMINLTNYVLNNVHTVDTI